MAGCAVFLLFSSLFTIFSATSSEVYNVVSSEAFNEVKNSKEIVAISFIRTVPSYSENFQARFSEAGDYLKDFGVFLGTINCITDPVSEYCVQADASQNVYIFRHGSFFIPLAYDTLFNVDAIVSNILHLVLLVDVPIIAERSDLTDKQDRFKGKRDIIVGYVPAVGIAADRAFMEVAFAYRHKYVFVVTTNRDLIDDEEPDKKPSLTRLPDPVVAISQCSKAEPHQDCLWTKFHGPITLESLPVLMKVLELPSMVDIFEEGQRDVYKEHDVPALYAVTDSTNHEQALSLIMEVKDEYKGNLGFVVIDWHDVSEAHMFEGMDIECIPACFVLQCPNQIISGDNIHDASDLRAFLKSNIQHVFIHLDNPPNYNYHEMDEDIDLDEDIPVQEQQDDLVQKATVHARLQLEPKKYVTPSLTDKTFPEFTGQSHLTSVLFTMQWNPRSLAFLESFDSAAESILAFFSSDIQEPPLARVECSDWPDVCDKSNVTVYPTVKMYRGQSDVATYGGILDKDNVLKSYLLYKLSNPMDLEGLDEVQKAVEGIYPAPWVKDYMTSFILAVIPDGYKQERAVYKQVAEELRGDFLFGLCTSQCAQQMRSSSSEYDKPSVTIMKWNDPADPQQRFTDEFTIQNLEAFIKESSLPLLPELTAASMPVYLAKRKPFVILFHTGDQISETAAQSMRQIVTSKTGNQYILCQMDISDEGSVGSETLITYGFLATPDQATIVILDHALGEVCRCPHGDDPSQAALEAWLEVSLESPKHCSEARALIEREWKPLVPPYDFLQFMEDEEHSKGAGRRGLGSPHDDETVQETEQEEEKLEQRTDEADVSTKDTKKHSHKHIEL